MVAANLGVNDVYVRDREDLFNDRPFYTGTQSGFLFYYLSAFGGWAIGPTLGATAVNAFAGVASPTPVGVGPSLTVWNGTTFVGGSSTAVECSTSRRY